jgi:SAM-dependent methyltransferase
MASTGRNHGRARRRAEEPRRFDLTERELEQVADARQGSLGPLGFARLLARSPSLVPETARTASAAITQSLAGSGVLGWLIEGELARRAVPDAATGVGWYPELELLEALEPWLHAEDVALELGCGAGRVSRHLAERVAHLICTDVSPTMVAEARRNLAGIENIEVSATDGFSLREYRDASFEVVLAAGVFGYIEIGPALAMFDEVRRVLGVGGVFAFNLALIDSPDQAGEAVRLAAIERDKRRFSGRVERPYCRAQIEALLNVAGLTMLEPASDAEPAPGLARTSVIARRL